MQTWKIHLELKISDHWVADGVDFSNKAFLDNLNEHIRNFMPYAIYETEFKVKSIIVSAPDKKIVSELQGY